MMVSDGPYDLVALFADQDAQKLVEALIERGQESGCLRAFRWRSLRDPLKDNLLRQPERMLEPFLGLPCKLLLAWDHEGSGRETDQSQKAETEVLEKLCRREVTPSRVMAAAFTPEVECMFIPVWERTKEILSQERRQPPPSDLQILQQALRDSKWRSGQARLKLPSDPNLAIEQRPKEMLEGLLKILRIPRSSELYDTLGRGLSIPAMKKKLSITARIAETLVSWFPPEPPSGRAKPPVTRKSRAPATSRVRQRAKPRPSRT